MVRGLSMLNENRQVLHELFLWDPTSSTIFSTTVYQRDEDLQQQTLHFFWEAIGTSTVTFKGLYLALLSLIKFPATTRAVHFNAHAYFFKYSSDR